MSSTVEDGDMMVKAMHPEVCRAVELIVYLFFLFVAKDAIKNGARWMSLLASAIGFGFVVEYLLTHPQAGQADYLYADAFRVMPLNVPLWIAVGWGCIIYACAWTTDRLAIAPATRPLAAGYLAVNADLSFDPLATDWGLWNWKVQSYCAQCDLTATDGGGKAGCYGLPEWAMHDQLPPPAPEHMTTFDVSAAPHLTFYNVPFHNFVAWFAIVATYVLATEILAAITRNMNGRRSEQHPSDWPLWAEIGVPVVSIALAFLMFLGLRTWLVNRNFGNDTIFDVIVMVVALVVAVVLVVQVLIRAKRSQPPNYATLAFAMLFHGLAFVLSLFHFGRQPSLPVAILMNATVGFLAFSWPFQRRLFDGSFLQWLHDATPEDESWTRPPSRRGRVPRP